MSSTASSRYASDGSLVALVDCDTFYASCERVARPDLVGRPIVVLSNNDGCIVARNREAKLLGIPMGVPEFKWRKELKRHRVAVFSSNYTLYGDLSRRVMQTIESVVPKMEIYSIDEAFVPLDRALATQALAVAAEIRSRVARWVGLPVSIGIAPTKVLAKIATSVAKKTPECHGIFDLGSYAFVDELLEGVPVKDIWGIGSKSALKLRMNGISTARDLRDAEPDMIRRLLTVTGQNILMELRGVPAIKEEIPASHNCVISSRSFGYKVSNLKWIEEAAAFHAVRAAEKLRQKHLLTGMVTVGIKTAPHKQDLPQHSEMRWMRLERPTLDSSVIIRAAREGLHKIYRSGYAYAKVMVMLTDLSDPQKSQPSMLNLINDRRATDARRKKLMELVDRVNQTVGRGTLRFASQGRPDAEWHMKRGRVSPAWTTDWKQLLTVGV